MKCKYYHSEIGCISEYENKPYPQECYRNNKVISESKNMSKKMRHKIIELIGNKTFKDRKELRNYLKKELGLPSKFTPAQCELEISMDECEGAGFIEQISYYRVSDKGEELIGGVTNNVKDINEDGTMRIEINDRDYIDKVISRYCGSMPCSKCPANVDKKILGDVLNNKNCMAKTHKDYGLPESNKQYKLIIELQEIKE